MICVNSVNVYPESITIAVGEWYHGAYAVVCPTNATCRSVTWHSEDTNIASVGVGTGYICGISIGTTKIYATATDESDKEGYITVNVVETVEVSGITLNRSSLSLREGTNASLTATVTPSNAENKVLEWESSDDSIATVSNGTVHGVSEGSATITAKATDGSGVSAKCNVTVTPNILVTDITVDPSTVNIVVGGSVILDAIICPTNATNSAVEWKSDNNSVATVNCGSGLVLGQNPGTATITATAIDGNINNAPGKALSQLFGWPNDVLTEIMDILEGTFTPVNLKNIDIYKKVQNHNYQIVFKDSGTEAYIQEVIANCENN